MTNVGLHFGKRRQRAERLKLLWKNHSVMFANVITWKFFDGLFRVAPLLDSRSHKYHGSQWWRRSWMHIRISRATSNSVYFQGSLGKFFLSNAIARLSCRPYSVCDQYTPTSLSSTTTWLARLAVGRSQPTYSWETQSLYMFIVG